LSAELLRSILKDYIENKAKFTLGETSYGKIIEQSGGNLENKKISDTNIASFRKIAAKYDLTYALKSDKTTNPPTWTVFFQNKTQSIDAFNRAFDEFSHDILTAEKKPIITRETLHLVEEVTPKKEQTERNMPENQEHSPNLWEGCPTADEGFEQF
jgi:hypothetical protein